MDGLPWNLNVIIFLPPLPQWVNVDFINSIHFPLEF